MSDFLSTVTDARKQPQRPCRSILFSALVMALTQMGSLNALGATSRHSFWRRYLRGEPLPSADRIGDVACLIPAQQLRLYLKDIYSRLKRRKAIKRIDRTALVALVVDGHECCASYLRHCEQCLTRKIETRKGVRTQYYHRLVMGVLLCKDSVILLDMEMQKGGEDEVACALRLIERLTEVYPRAFDVVLADGLYARASFFQAMQNKGKHVIAVLKDDRRELMKDVRGICSLQPPVCFDDGKLHKKCWDIELLASWRSLNAPVRVVRSVETDNNGNSADWWWVTTLPKAQLPTDVFISVAHKRWDIENRAFNELLTYWHADHLYKHDPAAIEFFWLLTMIAYDIFHAFFMLNIKPARRLTITKRDAARILLAELMVTYPNRTPP